MTKREKDKLVSLLKKYRDENQSKKGFRSTIEQCANYLIATTGEKT